MHEGSGTHQARPSAETLGCVMHSMCRSRTARCVRRLLSHSTALGGAGLPMAGSSASCRPPTSSFSPSPFRCCAFGRPTSSAPRGLPRLMVATAAKKWGNFSSRACLHATMDGGDHSFWKAIGGDPARLKVLQGGPNTHTHTHTHTHTPRTCHRRPNCETVARPGLALRHIRECCR